MKTLKTLLLLFLIFNINNYLSAVVIDIKTKNTTNKDNTNGIISIKVKDIEYPYIIGLQYKLDNSFSSDKLYNSEFEFKNLKSGKYNIIIHLPNQKDSIIFYKKNPVILK